MRGVGKWITLATAVALIAAEIAVRAIIVHGGDRERFLRYASARQLQAHPKLLAGDFATRYRPHRYLGYEGTPNFAHGPLRHNALGYKSGEIAVPKPAGEFRIVCMGGSTTYGTATPDAKDAYPGVLERLLHDRGHANARVINAGVEGYTSYENLILYALRVQDWSPDLVLILDGINDAYARVVWPHTAYTGDNGGYRAAPMDNLIVTPWYEDFALARVALTKIGMLTPAAQLRSYRLVNSATFFAEEWERQHVAGTYPSGVFREAPLEKMLEANTDAPFLRNEENLIALAQRRGARCVLVSVPVLRKPPPPGQPQRIWMDPAFARALDAANGHLRALAERSGAGYCDLAAALPQDAANFVDGLHLNVDGTAREAALIAEWLLATGQIASPRPQ
jgi:lysophospholipase L1-like esterase